jgi:hypothetical protein
MRINVYNRNYDNRFYEDIFLNEKEKKQGQTALLRIK